MKLSLVLLIGFLFTTLVACEKKDELAAAAAAGSSTRNYDFENLPNGAAVGSQADWEVVP